MEKELEINIGRKEKGRKSWKAERNIETGRKRSSQRCGQRNAKGVITTRGEERTSSRTRTGQKRGEGSGVGQSKGARGGSFLELRPLHRRKKKKTDRMARPLTLVSVYYNRSIHCGRFYLAGVGRHHLLFSRYGHLSAVARIRWVP